ncbi:MAG TPA: tetratricopeptide repeat protein [Thermoanaerobaculia bacterium]|nr:tetratricopeptide repeat protein [Thermoanaerobaculia bacterium]
MRDSKIVKIIGGLVTLVGVLASAVEIHGWWADRELTPAIAAKIESATRDAYQLHPDPSPVRDRAVFDAVAAVAAREKVSAEDAIELARELSRRLDLADESLERGLVMAHDHHFEQARREFLSASSTDPKSAAAWSNLAAVNSMLGRNDEARDAYNQALTLTPDDWRVRYNLGLLFARTGDPEEGLKHVSRALAYVRSAGDKRQELDDMLHDLRTDPSLEPLRQTTSFAALVGR